MSQIIALTAKEIDGRALSVPRVVYVPEGGIEFVTDHGIYSTLRFQEVKQGVKTIGKIMDVYESGREIEAAKDPASTHPAVAGRVATGATAAGNTQVAGYAVTKYLTEFTTVTGTTNEAATLPASPTVGDKFVIYNNDADTALLLFPGLGGDIDATGTDLSISVAAGEKVHVVCTAANTWTTAVDNG